VHDFLRPLHVQPCNLMFQIAALHSVYIPAFSCSDEFTVLKIHPHSCSSTLLKFNGQKMLHSRVLHQAFPRPQSIASQSPTQWIGFNISLVDGLKPDSCISRTLGLFRYIKSRISLHVSATGLWFLRVPRQATHMALEPHRV
jgi:hypothetical protein